jgi:predicted N-acetyltransferase YhbS
LSWLTRTSTPAELTAVRDITRAAFGRQFEVDYLDQHLADPAAYLPDSLFVATTRDDRPVAYSLLTRCHVDGVPILSLGPVAVLPEFQRRGAGGATVRAALAAAETRGEQAVVLLGHVEYYPRFGFRPAAEFGVTHPQYGGPHLMVVALGNHAVPPGLLTYPSVG